MAIRLTPDADAAGRIVTWGPDAPARDWRAETRWYRRILRWSRRIGVVLFLVWAYMTATGAG